uniref:Uncharacterized protein n=1 Tax=Syphacia muris TaxID=451379 RepID=A0A0N5ACC2_9BILA
METVGESMSLHLSPASAVRLLEFLLHVMSHLKRKTFHQSSCVYLGLGLAIGLCWRSGVGMELGIVLCSRSDSGLGLAIGLRSCLGLGLAIGLC